MSLVASTLQAARTAAERPGETVPEPHKNLGVIGSLCTKMNLEKDEVKRILIWNFRAGATSAYLLDQFPLAQVVSTTASKDFHVEAAKKNIDRQRPWRHVLRLGDNKEILSQLREFDDGFFDLVVVDRQPNEVEYIKAVSGSLPFVRRNTPFIVMGGIGSAAPAQTDEQRAASSAWRKLAQFGALRTDGAASFFSADKKEAMVCLRC